MSRTRRRAAGLVLAGAVVAGVAPRLAAAATTRPNAAQVARAESRLGGRTVPDIPVTLADGRRVQLADLWRDGPLLLTFYYRRCTGTCTPFLEWVRDAVQAAGGLGSDYRVLALTFDDAETTADLRAQAAALRLLATPHWDFAVAAQADVARVAAAVDFGYRLDPATLQYDHDSLLIGIDRGRVVRALFGTPEGNDRLRELVWELRGVFLPVYRVPGNTLLRCFRFDARSGRVRLDWGLFLLVLPGVGAICLALLMFAGAGPYRRVRLTGPGAAPTPGRR